jgi:hypothetical protein
MLTHATLLSVHITDKETVAGRQARKRDLQAVIFWGKPLQKLKVKMTKGEKERRQNTLL